jgi:hypothetical protein
MGFARGLAVLALSGASTVALVSCGSTGRGVTVVAYGRDDGAALGSWTLALRRADGIWREGDDVVVVSARCGSPAGTGRISISGGNARTSPSIDEPPVGAHRSPPGQTPPPTTAPPVGQAGLAAEPAAGAFAGGPATTSAGGTGTFVPSPTDPSRELSLDASATQLVSTRGWSVSAQRAIAPRAVYYLVTEDRVYVAWNSRTCGSSSD